MPGRKKESLRGVAGCMVRWLVALAHGINDTTKEFGIMVDIARDSFHGILPLTWIRHLCDTKDRDEGGIRALIETKYRGMARAWGLGVLKWRAMVPAGPDSRVQGRFPARRIKSHG